MLQSKDSDYRANTFFDGKVITNETCKIPVVKSILCYGDSNTWGYNYNFEAKGRFSSEERWPGVMQKQLGDKFRVLEEGLNGRTTTWDDPTEEFKGAKNGEKYLIPCLESHYPLDLVIIMLGTNDLKVQFSLTAHDIAEGVGKLVKITQEVLTSRQGYLPKILLVSPIVIGRTIVKSEFNEKFGYENSIEKSQKFAHYYKEIAERYSCSFMDAARIAQPNAKDAVHFDKEGHRKFGVAVAQKVLETLQNSQ